MNPLNATEIENSLLPFRIGRRKVLQILVNQLASSNTVASPLQALSRLFVRMKSADSIVEKVKRKGIVVASVAELPRNIPDILAAR